jgi:hypothetical protein
MKTFVNQCAQGDVVFVRISEIPADAVAAPLHEGRVVVALSETHHHHAFPTGAAVERFTSKDPFTAYLRVAGGDGDGEVLEHLRDYDTHTAIKFAPGNYMVRRQREHAPEGLRMVQD